MWVQYQVNQYDVPSEYKELEGYSGDFFLSIKLYFIIGHQDIESSHWSKRVSECSLTNKTHSFIVLTRLLHELLLSFALYI